MYVAYKIYEKFASTDATWNGAGLIQILMI